MRLGAIGLIFLSGSETFTQASSTAAYMKAAEDQVAEFVAQRMGETQPEMQQAKAALDSYKGRFHSALRETFTQLLFPDISSGRLEVAGPTLISKRTHSSDNLPFWIRSSTNGSLRTDVDSDGLAHRIRDVCFHRTGGPLARPFWRRRRANRSGTSCRSVDTEAMTDRGVSQRCVARPRGWLHSQGAIPEGLKPVFCLLASPVMTGPDGSPFLSAPTMVTACTSRKAEAARR